MTKYYYKNPGKLNLRIFIRIFAVLVTIFGVSITIYIFFPLLVWQFTLAPVFAAEGINFPIPRTIVVSPSTLKSLLATQINTIGTNYDDATNWFPNISPEPEKYNIKSYNISIPSIGIKNAIVSTTDTDLGHHLVHLSGTALPPDKGTAIVFGHSTLPQLFDSANYHTILANAYKIKVGDDILVTENNIIYTFKVFSLLVISPTDTSVLIQNFNDSYFELITCTPPGTVWQRLVIQSKLIPVK